LQGKHRLRGERDARNWTQKTLSEISGVSRSTISHIECRRGPDVPAEKFLPTKTKLTTIVKIVGGLGLTPGVYTVKELAKLGIFSENEFYEADANERDRAERRRNRKRRQLPSVA
jgi:transcriptional regulator with XRE-family HTH domain